MAACACSLPHVFVVKPITRCDASRVGPFRMPMPYAQHPLQADMYHPVLSLRLCSCSLACCACEKYKAASAGVEEGAVRAASKLQGRKGG
eukprot:scaffold47131_cov23-Tisochrysis_lutea.AAC.1